MAPTPSRPRRTTTLRESVVTGLAVGFGMLGFIAVKNLIEGDPLWSVALSTVLAAVVLWLLYLVVASVYRLGRRTWTTLGPARDEPPAPSKQEPGPTKPLGP